MNLNLKLENFETNSKGLIKIIKFDAIIGKKIFWDILSNCANNEVFILF
jgi:hypothetical protein